jgi:hypothetical protein
MAEKISPAVHDKSARREAFGVWKEMFVFEAYEGEMSALHQVHEAKKEAYEEEMNELHQLHEEKKKEAKKTRSEMVVK